MNILLIAPHFQSLIIMTCAIINAEAKNIGLFWKWCHKFTKRSSFSLLRVKAVHWQGWLQSPKQMNKSCKNFKWAVEEVPSPHTKILFEELKRSVASSGQTNIWFLQDNRLFVRLTKLCVNCLSGWLTKTGIWRSQNWSYFKTWANNVNVFWKQDIECQDIVGLNKSLTVVNRRVFALINSKLNFQKKAFMSV